MADAGIQTAPDQVPETGPPVDHGPNSRAPAKPINLVWEGLKPLASLRLTVVLFVLSMLLIFFGTLAQMDQGIWTVLRHYFRSFYVWVPFQIFVRFGQVFFQFPTDWKVAGTFPFPGGWLLGGLLLLNLVAAHAVRFKLSLKRSGIWLIHLGLIVMMLGELVTGLYAVEGNLTIENQWSSNYVEHRDANELAIVDTSTPGKEHAVVIPEALLRKQGLIQHDDLPFDVQVDQYMVNSSDPARLSLGEETRATAGYGLALSVEKKPEVTGTDPDQKIDIASAYVTFRSKEDGKALGTYLVSVWFAMVDQCPPQTVKVGETSYKISLRLKRTYKDYAFHLIRFRHDVYPGTDRPKNFSSRVRLIDPSQDENREALIYMNSPLRYQGETFYQSAFLPRDRGTILQVVHNPGWLMPYLSCTMVALGMLIHFGIHLIGFLRRRATV
jgi:hypothetical protein